MKQNTTIEKTEIDLTRIDEVIRGAIDAAIGTIRAEAATFVATIKTHYSGTEDDLVTTADKAAQKVYVDAFTKAFPRFGLIGEEDGLNKACTIPDEDIYITIDPLDGTKAFAREQSHGVGTMVGVVRNGVVIAGYVGDVNTGDIYGFFAGGTPIRTRFAVETPLAPKTDRPLDTRYILLNTPPYRFPLAIQKLVLTPEEGGLFKDVEVMGGSYGTTLARLWKGEVAAMLRDPGFTTPWDETPVLGLNKALGIITLAIHPDTCEVHVANITPQKKVIEDTYIHLDVHKDYAPTILEWFAQAKK